MPTYRGCICYHNIGHGHHKPSSHVGRYWSDDMDLCTNPPATLWETPEATPLLNQENLFALPPTEIQEMMIALLDRPTVYALRQTCRHFYYSFPITCLPWKAVMRWHRRWEMEPQNSALYACFSCFCLKPARAFMFAQINHDRLEKGASHTHRRTCMDCCVKRSIILVGDVVREATPNLVCACYAMGVGRFAGISAGCVGCAGHVSRWECVIRRRRESRMGELPIE